MSDLAPDTEDPQDFEDVSSTASISNFIASPILTPRASADNSSNSLVHVSLSLSSDPISTSAPAYSSSLNEDAVGSEEIVAESADIDNPSVFSAATVTADTNELSEVEGESAETKTSAPTTPTAAAAAAVNTTSEPEHSSAMAATDDINDATAASSYTAVASTATIPIGIPVSPRAAGEYVPMGIALPSPRFSSASAFSSTTAASSSSSSLSLSSSAAVETSAPAVIHVNEGGQSAPLGLPTTTPKAKPRTKNAQVRLSGFTLGVTWALQKIGKHEKTVESPEYDATVKLFQTNRVGLSDLLRWASEIHKNNRTVAITNQEFYSALGKLGGANKERASAETVQVFVPLALDLEVIRQRFDARLNTLLLEPLRDLVNNQIQNVLRLLSKLEVDRLDMDTKLHQELEYANKDPNDFGKVASQERAMEAKITYEKTVAAITDSCALIESTKRHLLQENLLEFVRAQSDYFEACSQRSAIGQRIHVNPSPPSTPRSSRISDNSLP